MARGKRGRGVKPDRMYAGHSANREQLQEKLKFARHHKPIMTHADLERRAPFARTGPSHRQALADELAGTVAFGQSQQIVLPLPVSVCPEIWRFIAIATDDVDVDFLSG